ncbi:hypothetical protein Tco_1064063 [Tanacetum coccineum]
MSEAKSTKKIDWNDPSVIRYHALKMKLKTVSQARRNMVKYLKNQGNYKIKHGSEIMKSPEKIEEEDVDSQKEMKKVSKESGAKRKKYLPRKSTRSTGKRQKMEEDAEKEEKRLQKMLNLYLQKWYSHTYADREEIPSKSRDDLQDVEKEVGG